MEDMPLGFSMSLAQNTEALRAFGALSASTQQAVIRRARQLKSKAEMDEFVATLVQE